MEEEFEGFEVDDHTIAKHQILKTYLEAWIPILSSVSARFGTVGNEPVFVDGFAGPGIARSRTDGSTHDGSPILALKTALDHSVAFPRPIRFLFIDINQGHVSTLRKIIAEYQDRINQHPERVTAVTIELGDCENVLRAAMGNYFRKRVQKVGPALFFLDQFGYTDVSMELIQDIMRHDQCEVFSYLNWQRMNEFMPDQTKWSGISKALGGDGWKKALSMSGKVKQLYMMSEYKKALREKAGIEYVWHFAMCGKNDQLIYWLFFCTNNIRGLEEMKKAMWRTDPSGGFRFSDKNNPNQYYMFHKNTYPLELKVKDIQERFHGQEISPFKVKEFVLAETPHYLFKDALRQLENDGYVKILKAKQDRRKGTFPDDDLKNMLIRIT